MKTCQHCRAWHKWVSQQENYDEIFTEEWILHKTLDSFLSAVQEFCTLCRYVRISNFRNLTDQELLERLCDSSLASPPIDGAPFATLRVVKDHVLDEDLTGSNYRFKLMYNTAFSSFHDFPEGNIEFFLADASHAPKAFPTAGGRNVTQNLKFLEEQLKICQETHSVCLKESVSDAYIPTRLIDVGTPENPQLKLRLCREETFIVSERYVTLSHMWGGQLQFMLQNDNLNEFREHISETKLPQTFQDAVRVARHFEIRYLWVDAMCIIQNDSSDWEREAAQMSSVFEHSYFTIAASYGTDSSKGLFKERTRLDIDMSLQIWHPRWGSQSFVMHDRLFLQRFLRDEPLYRRGWVLQEQFLSSRILHFTTHQVIWECASSFSCQSYPDGLPPSMLPWYRLGCGRIGLGNPKFRDMTDREKWREIIEDYSRRQITYSKDKLVAIQGLVSFFQRKFFKGEFLDGLWANDLKTEMLWSLERVNRDPPSGQNSAPSWSWASKNKGIIFQGTESSDTFLAEIESYSRTIPPSDSSPQPVLGSIILEGSLVELRVHCNLYSYRQISNGNNQYFAHFARWPALAVIEAEIQKHLLYADPQQADPIVDYAGIMTDLCEAAASVIIEFDFHDFVEQIREERESIPLPLWFLPLCFRRNGFVTGLLVRREMDNTESTYSRIGTVGMRCRNDEDYIQDMKYDDFEVGHSVMVKFLRGEFGFQQEEPERYGKRRIRLV